MGAEQNHFSPVMRGHADQGTRIDPPLPFPADSDCLLRAGTDENVIKMGQVCPTFFGGNGCSEVD